MTPVVSESVFTAATIADMVVPDAKVTDCTPSEPAISTVTLSSSSPDVVPASPDRKSDAVSAAFTTSTLTSRSPPEPNWAPSIWTPSMFEESTPLVV